MLLVASSTKVEVVAVVVMCSIISMCSTLLTYARTYMAVYYEYYLIKSNHHCCTKTAPWFCSTAICPGDCNSLEIDKATEML